MLQLYLETLGKYVGFQMFSNGILHSLLKKVATRFVVVVVVLVVVSTYTCLHPPCSTYVMISLSKRLKI